MVLVSTGPQKDKNGNPVATTQPTVLAHISGTTQPVALPLSIVTALQAQAKTTAATTTAAATVYCCNSWSTSTQIFLLPTKQL